MDRYKISKLIVEAKNNNKSIIMAGSAGAGKTTFVNQISSDLKSNNWVNLNADKYVEDKSSEFYNNLTKASNYIAKKELPLAIKNKKNFLYDTTGANPKTVETLKSNPGYETIMVMIYTHPIVSFMRNFKRERKVPAIGVLYTWNNVYKNIDHYKNLFGNNFYLTQMGTSEDENKLIQDFNNAHKKGKLKEFFQDILSTGKYKSTFSKSTTPSKTPEELESSKQKVNDQIDGISNQFDKIQDQVNELSKLDSNAVISKVKSFINK